MAVQLALEHGLATLVHAVDLEHELGEVETNGDKRHRGRLLIRLDDPDDGTSVPSGAVHPIPKVMAWLARHPRWTFHHTPTSGSWLNAVETFFSAITRRRLRRGVFHSLVDLQAAINRYLAEHNADPKPFVWTAATAAITSKLN